VSELARGSITDRPWGQTFGRLGSRGLTGQLNVFADGKQFSVAFAGGAVVAASSALPNDALVRIALTSHFITSTQVSEIARRLATSPSRAEHEVIAEIAHLAPDQVQRLRRRAVAQRAARTFSFERGEFVIEDVITLPVVAGEELDVRAVVYLGARGNLSDQRLEADLAKLGTWFQLKPDAIPDLAQYGFGDTEKRVLQRLASGATLPDLALEEPELDNRALRAVVYALASYGACDTAPPPGKIPPRTVRRPSTPPTMTGRARRPTDMPGARASPTSGPPMPRGQDIDVPTTVARSRTSQAPATAISRGNPTAPPPIAAGSGPQPRSRSTMNPPVLGRTPTPQSSGAPAMPRAKSPSSGTTPVISRTSSTSQAGIALGGPARAGRSTATGFDTERLIAALTPMVERGADHFELLGVGLDASTEQVRNAYLHLARKLHPDKLAALGISDAQRQAQRLFAQINAAFATLTDGQRRQEYVDVQRRGGTAAVRAADDKADELALKVLRAEESFKQGEMALRREQFAQAVSAFTTACELQPNEPEYVALLAWAKFAAAPDKQVVASATRAALQRASENSENSVTARFYLGRVERMLGREREALHHFHEVLSIKPHHADAASEARILEQRLKGRR
jgi:Flp pilus assembly protein TadD